MSESEHSWNILTFDGGGVRGLSSLLILQGIIVALREAAKKEKIDLDLDDLKPCDLFDFIAGSSTGGLIALMLGRLHMTIDECIEEYYQLVSEVFGNPTLKVNHDDPKWLENENYILYDSELLAQKVKDLVKKYTKKEGRDVDGSTERMEDPRREEACKTVVLAISPSSAEGPPILFRTYRSPYGQSERHYIWEAARATTAARPFFDLVTVKSIFPPQQFMDPCFGHNNPTAQAIAEIREIVSKDPRINCLLSIGTGLLNLVNLGSDRIQLRDAYAKILKSCDKTANEVKRTYPGEDSPYIRLSVTRGLEDMPEDEWTKMQELTERTQTWMREDTNMDKVDRCTEALMERVHKIKERKDLL